MKFKDLALLFSKLESTSKRLEMIDFLSQFFDSIKKAGTFDDIDKIIYLLQGRLISNIKQFPKMGLAEKMIIEAVSLHSGIDKKKVREILLKLGDVGAAAEYVLSKKKAQKSLFEFQAESIEISELYSELQKIALSEGVGSNDVKLGILRGLITKISPLETKYLLRIITSTLRVGIQTPTIIEGLALSFTNSRESKETIERAYTLHPDLGDVAIILVNKGLEAVELIDIEYKTPILSMLASREVYTEFINRLGIPFIAEYKLDGERLQIHKVDDEVLLFSRRLLVVSEQYPDVCKVVRENIQAKKAIIEGEVVAMDTFYEKMLPFQVLSKRRRKYDVEDVSKEVPVCLFVFDLLKCEDKSYIDESFPIRRKKLEDVVKEKDEIKVVEQIRIHSTDELVDFFNKARKDGAEGVMAKSIKDDSIYQAGNRGFKWLKLKGLEGGKLKDSIDVVLVGAFYGRGRRTGVYGTYIGAVYDNENDKFEAFTRISSGWTDEIMDFLTKEVKKYEVNQRDPKVNCDDKPDRWLIPEIVIEIIGDEITISDKFSSLGYSLRFPVFQRIRTDKGIKDITTVLEIENLYKTQ